MAPSNTTRYRPVCATDCGKRRGRPSSRSSKRAAIVADAATLAACGQSPLRNQHSDLRGSALSRQARDRASRAGRSPRSCVVLRAGGKRKQRKVERHRELLASRRTKPRAAEVRSGRRTAAHPTLPFGTKLRVTSQRTGRSVAVRVNDHGRLRHPAAWSMCPISAAQQLGMVGRGVAPKIEARRHDAVARRGLSGRAPARAQPSPVQEPLFVAVEVFHHARLRQHRIIHVNEKLSALARREFGHELA